MKPILMPSENPLLSALQYPIYASYKLDGIRCLLTRNGPKTRTLKDVPNKYIQTWLAFQQFEGLDGELIIGSPTDPKVFRTTTSGVMGIDKEPDFRYYAFDQWNCGSMPYRERIAELQYICSDLDPRIVFLEPRLLKDESSLVAFEEEALSLGYEGLILRNPNGLYKFGRCTLRENNSFKLKRYCDSEAYVVGIEAEMHNTNTKETNELGRSKRSTAKAGLVEKKSMGALVVRDRVSGVSFSIGTGFTAEDRIWWYNHWEEFAKSSGLVTYKYFPVGVKDKPRHPVFKGIRDKRDL
jgi:DNA ligase-1